MDDVFSKGGTAVIDAPERRYASDSGRPAGSRDRRLRRDLSEDFADPYDDDAPRTRQRGGGIRVRFGGLPRNQRGWIVTAVLLVLCLAACVAAALVAKSFLLHDERFVIPSSSSIQFQGNEHVTRAQLLNVFGGDIERNIFKVPLADRRAELEQMPWVAHATVMRLLPNRLRVSIVERTPVAFVRQGNHIGLVDANGVLLDMPVETKADAHYSFPVVTGISANDPVSTRAARMKIFNRFTSDLDSSGEKISQGLSEVDLSNPEDVKALIPDHSTDILVHFGDDDFLDRYRRFEDHLPEWRTVYPRLSSVDMRYERQVVLEMQPGSGVPMTSSTNAGGTASSADAGVASSASSAASRAEAHPAKVSPRVRPAEEKHEIARRKTPARPAAVKRPAHQTPRRETAAHRSVVKGRPHSAPAGHHTVVVRPSRSTPLYHPPRVIPR
jgi:cell division protein FtsQ